MFYESFANIVLFLSIRWRWSRDIILTVFLPIPVSRARPLQSIAPRCVDIMLAPVELRPQCGRNCKINVKLSRKIQLSITESTAEFGFDLFGEILYQAFAILGREPDRVAFPRLCGDLSASTSGHGRNQQSGQHLSVRIRLSSVYHLLILSCGFGF